MTFLAISAAGSLELLWRLNEFGYDYILMINTIWKESRKYWPQGHSSNLLSTLDGPWIKSSINQLVFDTKLSVTPFMGYLGCSASSWIALCGINDIFVMIMYHNGNCSWHILASLKIKQVWRRSWTQYQVQGARSKRCRAINDRLKGIFWFQKSIFKVVFFGINIIFD